MTIQTGIVAILWFLKKNCILIGNFPYPPYTRYQLPSERSCSTSPNKVKGEQNVQQWKKQTLKWTKYPVLFISWETEAEYVTFWKSNSKPGPVVELNLSLQAWALSTAPAGPNAIILTLEKKEMNRRKRQHLLYPPDSPSPGRLSHWASEFYQFVFAIPSPIVHLHWHPYPSSSRYDGIGKLSQWLHPGIHLEISVLYIFGISLHSDQVGNTAKYQQKLL